MGAFLLCSAGVFLAMFGFAATPPSRMMTLAVKAPNELSVIDRAVSQFKGNNSTMAKMALAPAVTSGWSIVNSPNINVPNTKNNFINAVDCVSASDCWAVGYYEDSYFFALIEHWDGVSWTIVRAPPGTSSLGNGLFPGILNSVTCASASDCWAVGNNSYNQLPLFEHWDGHSWTIIPNNITSPGRVSGVACASTSDCWSVGYRNLQNVNHAAIRHWDGASWSLFPSPELSPAELSAVTCASQTDCWAVGGTIIEHWDGTAWAVIAHPNPGGQGSDLKAIACVSSSDCWTVGDNVDDNQSSNTLIERWNGISWSIVPLASVPGALASMACTSGSDCLAVGSVIEHWNGSSWVAVTALPGGQLNGVTCLSASDCWAAGVSYGPRNQTRIEHWNGATLDIVISPDVGDTQDNVLSSVDCASASDCWSVGYSSGDSLIQRWDGNSWTIVAAPRNYYSPAGPEVLSGVVCTSASECWSLGNGEYHFSLLNYPGTYYGTFIDRWNGGSWSIGASFGVHPGSFTKLYGAACTSANDCWAVGAGYSLITHWNGSLWAPFSSPSPAGDLYGITCVSSAQCWAVGSSSRFVGPGVTLEQTFIEMWNGTAWSIIASPNTDSTHTNRLNSVACPATSSCFSVGYYVNSNGQNQQLLERWDGNTWVIANLPETGGRGSELRSITCPLPTQCWGVGYFLDDYNLSRTLIEQWNGDAWSIVGSPNSSSLQDNQLNSITCSSALECTAVGSHYESGAAQTLIEHWLSPVKVVSAVSRKSHGNAGAFDINLPLTRKHGVECRSGGTTGSYEVVITFAAPITLDKASFVSGAGHIDDTIVSDREIALNLSGVANEQTIVIRFTGVNDGAESGDVDIPMGVLLGDITGNGLVNAGDVGAVKKWTGQPVSAFSFREDVTANGLINSSDLAAVKAVAGTALP